MTTSQRLRTELQARGLSTSRSSLVDDQRLLLGFTLQRVSASGQIVIPVSVREPFGIASGGFVEVLVPQGEDRLPSSVTIIRRKALSNTAAHVTPGGRWVAYKVAPNGQLSLPAALRHQWSLQRGGSVELAAFEDKVIVTPAGGTDRLAAQWLSPAAIDYVVLEREGASAVLVAEPLVGRLLAGLDVAGGRQLLIAASEADLAVRRLVARTRSRELPRDLVQLSGVGAGLSRWDWRRLLVSLDRPSQIHPGMTIRVEAAGADAAIRGMRFAARHKRAGGDEMSPLELEQAAFTLAAADSFGAALMTPTAWLHHFTAAELRLFGLTPPPSQSSTHSSSSSALRPLFDFLLRPDGSNATTGSDTLVVDDQLIHDVGLDDLPDEDRELVKRTFYGTLESRTGMVIARRLNEDQLDEFEAIMDERDDEGALRWLEANVPDYRDVVREEFEKLKLEVRSQAPQILASVTASETLP